MIFCCYQFKISRSIDHCVARGNSIKFITLFEYSIPCENCATTYKALFRPANSVMFQMNKSSFYFQGSIITSQVSNFCLSVRPSIYLTNSFSLIRLTPITCRMPCKYRHGRILKRVIMWDSSILLAERVILTNLCERSH